MARSDSDELEGNTLSVYVYVAKAGRPVGTRDVTRGANLSSPSVAHRHLQKLETLGLLQKNEYSDYFLKEKTPIGGHVWVGKNIMPRLMFYAFFFMGALSAEVVYLTLRYLSDVTIETGFLLLTAMTTMAMVLFLAEGAVLRRKIKPKHIQSNDLKTADSAQN